MYISSLNQRRLPVLVPSLDGPRCGQRGEPRPPGPAAESELADRLTRACVNGDVDALVAMLTDDVLVTATVRGPRHAARGSGTPALTGGSERAGCGAILCGVASPRRSAGTIDLIGDAQIMLTAPFFPDSDPLGFRPGCTVPPDGVLESGGRLVLAERSLDDFLRGSLTFGNPPIVLLLQFAGTERFNAALSEALERLSSLPLQASITGILFPDGYGSVAVRIVVPDGWTAGKREPLLSGFGPEGRDPAATLIRDALLPALSELSDNCCPSARCKTLLPYFNQTYVAETSHPRPGRAILPDAYRRLIYPRSAAPIKSDSPWASEFFFAGYAFSLLASARPQRTLDQLEHLLLNLNVLNSRMEKSAAAADQMIRSDERKKDIDWLVELEQRLRADYHALIQPTFSYDHHVLMLRDSLLRAWQIDKTRERTDTLLHMARQAVENQVAREQARRINRVNLIVTILTVVSLISSVDASVDLWTRFFK